MATSPSGTWQLIGNLLLLAPMGVALAWLLPSMRPRHALALIILASLAIEAAQLIVSMRLGYTYKITDVDDVLLNFAGGAVGFAVTRLAVTKFGPDRPAETTPTD